MSRDDEKNLRLDKRAKALRDNMRKRKAKQKELKDVSVKPEESSSKP